MKGKVLIGELGIHYEIQGEGPSLLILHGWGSSTESWQEIKQELSSNFKVIVLDLPGFGKSETPEQPWTVQNYLNFLERFVQELELDNMHLLGHSFGGSLSVKFASEHPEKIRKMILVDSAGIRPRPRLLAKIIKQLAKKSNHLFVGPLSNFKGSAKELLHKFLRNSDYGKADEIMKETMKNVFEYYTSMEDGSGEFISDLERVKNETLLVWGKEDKIIPVKFGKIFQEKINNSELKTITGVGHSPHLKSPSKLIQIILQFLNDRVRS